MGMSPNEQGDCVEKANLCPIHLVRSHTLADCNAAHDAKSICGIDGCTRHHHKSLHGGTSPFLASVLMTASTDSSIIEPKNVLLSMQSISSLIGLLNCLFDNAATCSLITTSAAKRLKLCGEPIKLTISTVTGSADNDSMLHCISLVDKNGATHTIEALQVDNISIFCA